jgi:hypothetical protein
MAMNATFALLDCHPLMQVPVRKSPSMFRHVDMSPVKPYGRSMKTTIEIPDSIARQARLLAVERQTTLRALVVQGLEHVLSEKQVTAKERAKKLFAAMDKAPGISAGKRLNRTDANAR